MRKIWIAIFLMLFLVLLLAYRLLDMAITLDHRDRQAETYKTQRDEAVAVLDRALHESVRERILVISDPALIKDFLKESGSTLTIGSLRYNFQDGRCSRVLIDE